MLVPKIITSRAHVETILEVQRFDRLPLFIEHRLAHLDEVKRGASRRPGLEQATPDP